MRLFVVTIASVLMIGVLAACVSERDEADDTTEPAAVQTTPTPEPEPDPTPEPEPTDVPIEDDDDVDPADDADDTDAADDSEHEPTEHIVEIVNPHDFAPDNITILVGDTVTWVNNSDMPHTATADPEIARDEDNVSLPEGAEPFNSGSLQPGDEFSHTFDVPGEYIYFCIPHEALGQIGTITVVEDPADLETADSDDDNDNDSDGDDDDGGFDDY